MDIKAIETRYKGYRFRSRLEARWAVFFDAMGFEWEYEPEGYKLPSGAWYLPDFKVQGLGWFEIKPKSYIDDFFRGHNWDSLKEAEFFSQPGIRGGVLAGDPWVVPEEYDMWDAPYVGISDSGDAPYCFCECRECGSVGFQFDGRAGRNLHLKGCSLYGDKSDIRAYGSDTQNLRNAYQVARSARWEHGETPNLHKAPPPRFGRQQR